MRALFTVLLPLPPALRLLSRCSDAFNARMVGEGILHHTCLQGSPNWLVEGTDRDYKLLDFPTQAIEGASVDPLQWRVAGEMGFQWAARYGHVSVSANLLRTRPLCQWNGCFVNKTGLGTASWVEFQNEPDKDWRVRQVDRLGGATAVAPADAHADATAVYSLPVHIANHWRL